jgi:hypothetical protein
MQETLGEPADKDGPDGVLLSRSTGSTTVRRIV